MYWHSAPVRICDLLISPLPQHVRKLPDRWKLPPDLLPQSPEKVFTDLLRINTSQSLFVPVHQLGLRHHALDPALPSDLGQQRTTDLVPPLFARVAIGFQIVQINIVIYPVMIQDLCDLNRLIQMDP